MDGKRRQFGPTPGSDVVNDVERLRPWLDVLGCPDCVWGSDHGHSGSLLIASDGLVCAGCGHRYPVVDGVVRLIGNSALPKTWDQQVAFFDGQLDSDFELNRPEAGGRFYNYLIRYKIRMALMALGRSLAGGRVVDACCGSGMVSGLLAETSPGIRLLGFDASSRAVWRACQRAARRGYQFVGVVADAQYPPLRSTSDVTVVTHDALHHLEKPMDALKRLASVGKELLVMEPQQSVVTRVAVLLRISTNTEEAGNRVMRIQPADVASVARAMKCVVAGWWRYLMYYPHQPGSSFRRLDGPFLFLVARAVFLAINATIDQRDTCREGG